MKRVFTGWLGLVVLYTALTRSEKLAAALGTTTEAVRRLSSPDVALVPNLSGASSSSAAITVPRDNTTAAVYGSGGSYVGGTFVPAPQNGSGQVYGSGGGQYIGSTFVPYSVNVPQNLGQ